MNNFKKIFLLKDNLLYFSVFVMVLSTVTLINPYSSKLNIIILLWGACYFIYNLFIEKTNSKSRYNNLLILYTLFFLMTILFNCRHNLIGNLKTFSYVILFIFILYPEIHRINKVKSNLILFNINNIAIFISLFASFASLLTFLFLLEFKIDNITQGFIASATSLWGFYSNPNSGGMISVLSILFTIFNIYLSNYLSISNSSKLRTFIYYLNLVIQWLYLILSNSRGANLTFTIILFFIAFYIAFNKIYIKTNISKTINTFISFSLSFLIIFSYISVIDMAKTSLSYIPVAISNLDSNYCDISNLDAPASVNLDREIPKGNISTGRLDIWSYGIDSLRLRPLLGHGPDNITSTLSNLYKTEESAYATRGNMHNGYIQILVSNGVLGFSAFLTFMFLIIKDSFKYLFKYSFLNKCDKTLFFIILIISSIAINGLFENVILLTTSYTPTILWIYLSFLSFNLNIDEI